MVDPASTGGAGTEARTVVVDDSDETRMLLGLTLETDDRFEMVGSGRNGEEAIDLADRLHPDVIILDENMPVLGGTDAIPEIHRRSPDTAVVLYTAADDGRAREDAVAAGAVCVVDKSVVTVELLETVAAALGIGRRP